MQLHRLVAVEAEELHGGGILSERTRPGRSRGHAARAGAVCITSTAIAAKAKVAHAAVSAPRIAIAEKNT